MFATLKRYGLVGFLRLGVNLVITKVCFQPARIIRMPFYIRGQEHISWGAGFTTGVGTRLDAFGKKGAKLMVIGERVQINDYVHIGAVESIRIGNDVLIASKVFITDHNHGEYGQSDSNSTPDIAPIDRPLSAAPVIIEDSVWLGEGVSVLPGVTIGQGSIVGAGAVVVNDIPPNAIAVGMPAKVIKVFDDALKQWVNVSR